MEYIDLQKSYMYVRAKIMKINGDSLSDSDKVGVVNLFLPSLFEQCTVTLQGKIITSSTGHYPYRAMIQTILKYRNEANNSQLLAQLWVKDTPGTLDDPDLEGLNIGLYERSNYFKTASMLI